MKKTLKYIIFTSIMMFIGLGSSMAAKANYECNYTLKLDDLKIGKKGSTNIKVSVYDKKASINVSNGNYVGDERHDIIMNVDSNFERLFFDYVSTNKNCPTIKLAATDNAAIIAMPQTTITGQVSYASYDSKSNSGSQKEQQKKEVCHFQTKSIKTQSVYLTVYFYTTGSNKTWKIIKNDEKGNVSELAESKYNEQIVDTSTGAVYKVAEADYDGFWNSSTCSETKYVQNEGGLFTIQSAKPDAAEDAETGTKQTEKPNDPTIRTFDGCADMPETTELLRQVYKLLRYLIPVIIIVLSIVDFIKVVANGDDKEYKGAWNKLIKRIVVGMVILIVPALVSFIINISGITSAYGIKDLICVIK